MACGLGSCGTWAPEHAGSVVMTCRFSCSAACGISVPLPGIEPTSPALQGVFLATGQPGKSQVQGSYLGWPMGSNTLGESGFLLLLMAVSALSELVQKVALRVPYETARGRKVAVSQLPFFITSIHIIPHRVPSAGTRILSPTPTRVHTNKILRMANIF